MPTVNGSHRHGIRKREKYTLVVVNFLIATNSTTKESDGESDGDPTEPFQDFTLNAVRCVRNGFCGREDTN